LDFVNELNYTLDMRITMEIEQKANAINAFLGDHFYYFKERRVV
jgi:hypothetical protein